MSSRTLALVEPGQLDLADLDHLDLSLPACCVIQNTSSLSPTSRTVSTLVSIGMTARAVFVPMAQPEMSLNDYMTEAYHQLICGNEPRRAVDPVVFDQNRDILVMIAWEKRDQDRRSGKIIPQESQAPPPTPTPAPCCAGQATSLVLRRQGRHFVPA